MLLWILVIVLLGGLTVAGYYQGAVRAVFALLGLLLGAILSLPLSGVGQALVSICGVTHPVLLDFLGPLLVLVLVFIVLKSAGFYIHSRIHWYFKYKTDDQRRTHWERLNQQLGICLGVFNGVVLVFLVCTGIYVPGYFAVQVASAEKDPWWLNLVNSLTRDLDKSGFGRALSLFMPTSPFYFEAADTLGLIFQNPRLQNRLSRYPLLLPLSEEQRFQEIGDDSAFQDIWKKQPSIQEFMGQARINPLVRDIALYTNLVGILRQDLRDLRTYLETGVSPKFADAPLVDRWQFNYPASWAQSKQNKPNMTVAERQWLKAVYLTSWDKAILVAFLDQSMVLKNKSATGKAQSLNGKWKHAYGSKYLISLREEGKRNEFEALVQTNKLTLTLEKLALVFDR